MNFGIFGIPMLPFKFPIVGVPTLLDIRRSCKVVANIMPDLLEDRIYNTFRSLWSMFDLLKYPKINWSKLLGCQSEV